MKNNLYSWYRKIFKITFFQASFLLTIVLVMSCSGLLAQRHNNELISGTFFGYTFDRFVDRIEKETSYKFYYDQELLQRVKVSLVADGHTVEQLLMKPLISPDIEDIYFTREEDGVYIYLNSKMPTEEMFFQWTSTEDWEFKSPYHTFYKYDPDLDDVVFRDDNINLCFKSAQSSAIHLGSSSRSVDGSITGEEVMRIPLFSEKLGSRYSIEVVQKPIDQEAFEFWESIRKNTDDIGNIFSPLPSILGSNLTKVGDPATPVIGYISAGKSAKKRLFINFTDIRPWTVRIPDYINCNISLIRVALYSSFFNQERLIPLYETVVEFPEGSNIFVPAFAAASKFCVDCRERGTKEKPGFWD